MCGITGFIGKGNEDTLQKMTAAVKHRGPDDTGIFFDEQKGIGLGHARLSILDVSAAGHQPMWSSDKQIAIVFNGEIYNFQELKTELKAHHGCRFESTSDTEVIIYAYKVFGEKCFEKMEGMFAIAIYDFPKNRLILARDRAGKKPLYWTLTNGTFIFGSELKSLVLHPAFKKELDLESVNKYLQFDYVPTPHTIWKNVHKLEPASYMVFEAGKIRKAEYWLPKFEETKLSFAEAKKRLGAMIAESVSNRLVADVPVGVFLSGGLDSSTIAYYAKQQSKSKVKTFSIGFQEKSFDESNYAREVATFLGTEHYEKIFTSADCISVIPEVLNALDEPMADASIIPTYLLSQFAREYVTVALGGDGGDELFAGYPTFQAEKLLTIYKKVPAMLRSRVIEPLIRALPSSANNFSLDFKLKKFLEGVNASNSHRHQVWLGSFNREERSQLFKPEVWNRLENNNEFEDTEVGPLLYQYERTYLMDEVLVKVDRATMLASLEARSPFLDYRIADFAHSLPYDFKIKGFKTKYILKKLMEGKLPREIIWRKKKGFGMPVGYWLRGPLKELMENVLSKENVKKMGLFNYDYIAKLKSDHYSERKDNRKLLWNLLVFGIWWNKFNS